MPGAPRFRPGGRPRPGRRAERGLITLEWLLVVGAIAGLAASSVVIVQQVLDDHSEVPADPLVRMLEADVAAAWVAAEAQAAFDARAIVPYTPAVDDVFARTAATASRGTSAMSLAAALVWVQPYAGPDGVPGNADDVPARCTVAPQPNLGA